MSRPDTSSSSSINDNPVAAGRDNFGSTAKDSIVGGPMDVDVQIVVGPKARLHPEVRTLRVRLKELPDTINAVQHGAAEDHADVLVDVREAGLWHKWVKVAATTDDPSYWKFIGYAAPGEENTSESSFTYTHSFAWYTTQPRDGADADGGPARAG